VFGGVREFSIIDNRGLDALSAAYIQSLKSSCTGEFTSSLTPVETLEDLAMRVGDASCRNGDRATYFRHVYYINKARIFTIFIHEGDDTNNEQATKARDSIAAVIRRVAGS
jgi:hypothetical protein